MKTFRINYFSLYHHRDTSSDVTSCFPSCSHLGTADAQWSLFSTAQCSYVRIMTDRHTLGSRRCGSKNSLYCILLRPPPTPFTPKASTVALKRDGPENWASYSSFFFIHIKIHKSFWVGRSRIDEQVTCRRVIPPSKNGLSVITKRYGFRHYILYKETQGRWGKLCSACNVSGVNKTVPSIITVLAAHLLFFFQLYNSLWVLASSIIPFHCFLSCVLCFRLVTPIFLKSFLTPYYHLTLGLPFGLVAYGFHLYMVLATLSLVILSTCPNQLSRSYFM